MEVAYKLEKYSGPKSRYTCPNCSKPRQFTRYINSETGEYLADHVGICNRVNKCGYHFPPSQYFEENPRVKRLAGRSPVNQRAVDVSTQPCIAYDYINWETVAKTLLPTHYHQN